MLNLVKEGRCGSRPRSDAQSFHVTLAVGMQKNLHLLEKKVCTSNPNAACPDLNNRSELKLERLLLAEAV